jgi:hypothetical protein
MSEQISVNGYPMTVSLEVRDGVPLVGPNAIQLDGSGEKRLAELDASAKTLYAAARAQHRDIELLERLSGVSNALSIALARMNGQSDPDVRTAKGFTMSLEGTITGAFLESYGSILSHYREQILPGARLAGL